jgi:hypothetical protein
LILIWFGFDFGLIWFDLIGFDCYYCFYYYYYIFGLL